MVNASGPSSFRVNLQDSVTPGDGSYPPLNVFVFPPPSLVPVRFIIAFEPVCTLHVRFA